MKQVFQTNLGMKVFEVPIPPITDNEILVEVRNSLISTGTEGSSLKPLKIDQKIDILHKKYQKVIHILKQDGLKNTVEKVYTKLKHIDEYVSFSPLGYSNAGVVIAKGRNVIGFNIGDHVACAGNALAVHGEYATVPQNLVVNISKQLSFKQAAFTTIGSIAMQGIRRAGVQPGETIIIYGLGLIGLLAVQIANAWGLETIGLDIDKKKIELALKLGADYGFDVSTDEDYDKRIKQITSGYGADASIIYASSTSDIPVNSSFKFCRPKANIVIVGSVGMKLERADFYKKEQNLLISTSYGPGRYDPNYEDLGQDYPIGYVRWTENRNMQEFVRLLDKGKILVEPLISKEEKIDNALSVYKMLAAPDNNILTVLFEYSKKEKNEFNEIINTSADLSTNINFENQINVGVIGAGGYLSNFILPELMNLSSSYSLLSVSNKTGASTLKVVKKFHFKQAVSDYHDILNDPDINLVLIGTRHNLHADLVIDSLNSGKDVFVEKPLSLLQEDIVKIQHAVQKNKKRVFVGFNRRYSELTQKVKQKLENAPLLMTYRVNAGIISMEHWVQSPLIGGGRLIGEVCHFIDYCNYMIQSDVVSFNIDHIPVDGKLIPNEDNFVLTLKYDNGSIASVIYTSIGGRRQGKEYIEIFQNTNTFIIDDFITYICFDQNEKKIFRLKLQDKGRAKQMEEIAKTLLGADSLVPDFKYDVSSSLLAIKAQGTINGQNRIY